MAVALRPVMDSLQSQRCMKRSESLAGKYGASRTTAVAVDMINRSGTTILYAGSAAGGTRDRAAIP